MRQDQTQPQEHQRVPDEVGGWRGRGLNMREKISRLGRALKVFHPDRAYAVCSYHLAVDFGQSQDYSAACLLREEWATKTAHSIEGGAWREVSYGVDDRKLEVVHLQRLDLHMSYPDQVDQIIHLAHRTQEATSNEGSINEPIPHVPALYITGDATGVGRGPIDLIRKAGLRCRAVTITAGGGPPRYHEADGDWHCAKRDLVVACQIAMQRGALKIAKGIPDAEVLKRELSAFKYRISPAAHDTYSVDWREGGQHDDLVLALCLAVFSANLAAGWRESERASRAFIEEINQYQLELGG